MDDQNDPPGLRNRSRGATPLRLALLLLLLLPLAIVFLLPSGALIRSGFWFWAFLVFSFWIIWSLLRRTDRTMSPVPEPEAHPLYHPEQPEPVREVMDVRVATEQSGVRIFRGRLRESAAAAYETLKHALGAQTVPLIQEDEQLGAAILLVPKPVEKIAMEKQSHAWVNWLLFALTILTTTWAGAAHQGVQLIREPSRFFVGLPYSIGLLAILGVHELGHFFAARRHGMNVTPPYFIPVPFALGTFGAFIRMRSPPEDRCSLFDVAIAGPLAGLAVAIPALLIGLHSSVVVGSSFSAPLAPVHGASAGSSILFALLAKVSLGAKLWRGDVLRLSPLAFAGWLGLVITALNLLPIGQLDGGHTARAMFGNHAGRIISTIATWALFFMALFVWRGLIVWAIIVFFIAGRGTPPLNDLTPLTPGRRWLGFLAFFILALILVPLPLSFWNQMGIYCPYI